MDFVVLDFETAALEKFNPCEIGLTFVQNSQIVLTKSWLIKPPCYPNFDFVAVHGITPMSVASSPEFPGIWPIVCPLIEGKLVFAHYASFDIDVLCSTLTYYGLPLPNLTYGCTRQIARIVYPKRVSSEANDFKPYGLAALCKANKIKFNHHRAGDDAEATAKLALKMFEKSGVFSVEDITAELNIRLGRITSTGQHYRPYKLKSNKKTKRSGESQAKKDSPRKKSHQHKLSPEQQEAAIREGQRIYEEIFRREQERVEQQEKERQQIREAVERERKRIALEKAREEEQARIRDREKAVAIQREREARAKEFRESFSEWSVHGGQS